LRRGWLKGWYVLLALLLLEAAGYALCWSVASYWRQAARLEFNAAAAGWHEAGRVPYADLINRHAREAGVSARVAAAVIQAESSFQPRALSRSGAAGLMQVIPSTWRQVNKDIKACAGRHAGECTPECYYDPDLNIRIGTAYLGQLVRRYNGDVVLALAAYNAGPGAVDSHGGVPGYAETEEYVARVMGYWYNLGHLPQPLHGLTIRHAEQARQAAAWAMAVTAGLLVWLGRRLAKLHRSWRWH
jgi:soluble lytic murein transglycosylase-like protein